MAGRRGNGRSYPVKGVPIGVPRYSFDPKAGDVFYVMGKTATISRTGKSDGTDYVWFKRAVDGTLAMSVSNLYQIAKVPETSRFAPYEYRSRQGNPSTTAIPRNKWVNGQVRVTKSGKVEFRRA